jgi:CBS domain containing-hemolysin-like protein
MALGLVGALLFVAANAFFVASEFAIARIRPTQVAELESAGRPGVSSLRHAVDHIDAYLAACQLGITISSIGLGVVGKPAFQALLEPVAETLGAAIGIAAYALSFAAAFSLVTLLHVVLGELAPKSFAISRTTLAGLAIAAPLRLFYVATKPFVDFFNWLGNLVLRPFGIPPAREVGHAPHTEDELRLLLEQSLEEGLIDPEERAFAENVFIFGDRRAREVMVPRPEIDFLTTRDTVEAAASRSIESGHTRLPLCDREGGLDAPLGVINVKDVLRAILDREPVQLAEIVRPLQRVSESTLIDELLAELRPERQHIALVVDEHGTTVGLITLEDILEEIVGEIEDEFDPDAIAVITNDGDGVVVKACAPVQLVSRELGIHLAEPGLATIGGHVLELLGRLPESGEAIEIDGYRVETTAVADGRIIELRFTRTG